MGCGKSSVGRRLSQLLCCPFMDLDSVIEERTGRSIPEIFKTDGEKAFREIEKAVLTDLFSATMAVSSRGPLPLAGGGKMPLTHNSHAPQKADSSNDTFTLSLGGGTVMTPECEAMVHEKTLCIYLRTSVETLVRRLTDEAAGRPMLNVGRTSPDVRPSGAGDSVPQAEALRTRIISLMAQRASTYERTAHIIIDTDSHTIDTLARSIQSMISK